MTMFEKIFVKEMEYEEKLNEAILLKKKAVMELGKAGSNKKTCQMAIATAEVQINLYNEMRETLLALAREA